MYLVVVFFCEYNQIFYTLTIFSILLEMDVVLLDCISSGSNMRTLFSCFHNM